MGTGYWTLLCASIRKEGPSTVGHTRRTAFRKSTCSSRAAETEGDGWLLGPFLDLDRRTAGLNVFDAAHLADGPLWEGILPYPLPLALHGTFVGS